MHIIKKWLSHLLLRITVPPFMVSLSVYAQLTQIVTLRYTVSAYPPLTDISREISTLSPCSPEA